MKRILISALLFFMLVTCSPVSADDLSDVRQAGVLRFGHHLEYIPFVFEDASGSTTGIDIALMEEAARRMGIRLETIPFAWDGILDALILGQVDVIGGALARTDERMEKIDFSRAYYNSEAQFIALSSFNASVAASAESLRGKKIGVEKGSSFEEWVKKNMVETGLVRPADVFSYSSLSHQINDLNNGTVNAILTSQDLYLSLLEPTGKYKVLYDGFLTETYAFGVRKGSTLTQEINTHLNDMIRDGIAQSIADRFFNINFSQPETVLTRPAAPTAVPLVVIPSSSACINAMSYVADVTVPDGTSFSPGQKFRKTWRVMNNGSCTWNSEYYFEMVSGTSMGNSRISIPGTVQPGETADLSVDMTAPGSSGSYKTSWQMRSPQGTSFGQIIWASIRVGGGTPAPTDKPEDGQKRVIPGINYFYLDSYEGEPGSCTYAYWSVSNTAAIDISVDGILFVQSNDPSGYVPICDELNNDGTHQITLTAHTVTDDAVDTIWYTTSEGQKQMIPVINYFNTDSDFGEPGSCVNVSWDVSNAASIEISVDGSLYLRSNDENGFVPVCDEVSSVGTHTFTLTAHTVTDDATSECWYETVPAD